MRSRARFSVLSVLFSCTLAAQPTVTAAGETMRLRSSNVTRQGAAWAVTLEMDDDNGNSALPSSFRRWWHCEIGGLNAATGEILQIAVTRPGYSDIILPAWSLSTDGGASFGAYERVPVGATPVYQGGQHRFTLQTPVGVTHLRLAKSFPYTPSALQAFLNSIVGHPSGHVRSLGSLGSSAQGRPIQMLELTNSRFSDAGKRRIWIHSGIHPAETTSYFVVEGLVEFLLSGDILAESLLQYAIIDIVPMANPDGVALGNYRTTSQSVNLEERWTQPYTSTVPEIVALRTRIEQYMGTAAAPGANPIVAVFNLHSSHNVSFPFHFRHTSNPGFDLQNNRTGVIPVVNALESAWIAAFDARSPLTALGSTQSSSCGAPTRPFVECMMHDRWSVDPAWNGEPVMSITFEGTYRRGPDGVTWNTQGDYRQVGSEMGLALADYLGVQPSVTLEPYGASCSGLQLTGDLRVSATSVGLDLAVVGSPSDQLGVLFFGLGRQDVPIPPTFCPLRTTVQVTVPITLQGGRATRSVALPRIPNLVVHTQAVTGQLIGNVAFWYTSNGLTMTVLP